jgi:hypothetical protein
MTNRRGKETRKRAKEPHRAQNVENRSDASRFQFTGTRFRLLAFQPLSLSLELPIPFELSIQNIQCCFALRPAHIDESLQRTHGGTMINVEFSTKDPIDLFAATQEGLDLIEDFFAALSLVEGATFRDMEPVQIVNIDQTIPEECTFVHFLNLSINHWHKPVSKEMFQAAQGILAHWDGLESGKRLRRAARQFQKAIGADDALTAFQYAYTGLEAIEKPLADIMGISAGAAEVEGHCEKCGERYVKKRSMLAAVRAYVTGAIHPKDAIPEKKKEWKDINNFRHDIFHSLEDVRKLELKAPTVLTAAMHHLHDAVCCLSHSHGLESDTFKLVRGMARIVFIGTFRSAKLEPIEDCQALLKVDRGYWVLHPQYRFVPRFKIEKSELDLGGIFCWLKGSLRDVKSDDLVPANFEDNQNDDSDT